MTARLMSQYESRTTITDLSGQMNRAMILSVRLKCSTQHRLKSSSRRQQANVRGEPREQASEAPLHRVALDRAVGEHPSNDGTPQRPQTDSFEQSIRLFNESLWNRKAKLLCRLEVDYQLKLLRILDGQHARRHALQYFVDERGRTLEHSAKIGRNTSGHPMSHKPRSNVWWAVGIALPTPQSSCDERRSTLLRIQPLQRLSPLPSLRMRPRSPWPRRPALLKA